MVTAQVPILSPALVLEVTAPTLVVALGPPPIHVLMAPHPVLEVSASVPLVAPAPVPLMALVPLMAPAPIPTLAPALVLAFALALVPTFAPTPVPTFAPTSILVVASALVPPMAPPSVAAVSLLAPELTPASLPHVVAMNSGDSKTMGLLKACIKSQQAVIRGQGSLIECMHDELDALHGDQRNNFKGCTLKA